MSQDEQTKSAEEIERWLVAKIAAHVRVAPGEIGIDDPITGLGIDSTEAVVLSGELQQWLGVKVPPTVAWDHPTIAALARFLEGRCGR